jgi:hypothetical protein
MRTDDDIRATMDRAENADDAGDDRKRSRRCLTVQEWARREAAEEDLLLGGVYSTSSIIQFAAETGIGKTMFCIAIGFAMALGVPFLHWKSRRKARVLYIDGEMPVDLMKERILAACKWFGVEPDIDGLSFLSREDFDDLPPLNTPDGYAWLDRIIKEIGGVDFIIFDNIMSLTIGDLKEPDSWQAMRPKMKELQRRRIGQLWVHHAGHDRSRSYGDKTREWDIDAAIIGERADANGADVAIKLTFPKARRRRPATAADFEPVTIELRDNEWSVGVIQPKSRKSAKLSTAGKLAIEGLEKALTYVGQRPDGHEEISGINQAVTVDQWRHFFLQIAADGTVDPNPNTVKSRWKRGQEDALGKGAARQWGQWVWKV